MGLVSKPNTFSAGAVIVASEHNENFDTLYSLVNGNLDKDNISASSIANVTETQTITGTKTFENIILKAPIYDVRASGAVGNGSTDDTTAIQSAIDAMTSGGTVFFPKLTSDYKVSDVIDIDVADNITLLFEKGASIKASVTGKDIFNITKDYCSIIGATLEGEGTFVTSGSSGAIIIDITGSNTTIQDCYLKEFEQTGIKSTGNYTIIKNCIFEGGPYFADAAAIGSDRQHYAIWLYTADNCQVTNNIIKPNSDVTPGVTIQGITASTSSTACMNAQIIGNEMIDCWNHGLYIIVEGSTITNNTMTGCGAKLYMRTSGNSTQGNTFSNNTIFVDRAPTDPVIGESGLVLHNAKWSTIADNVIRYAGDAGILLLAETPFEVSHNTITGNTIDTVETGAGANCQGIDIDGSITTFSYNVISNNTISNLGAADDGNHAGIFFQPAAGITHVGNVISNNTIDTSMRWGMLFYYISKSTISGNTIRNCARDGIYIYGGDDTNCCEHNVISGNSINDNATNGAGVGTTTGYAGIQLVQYCHRNLISNNIVTGHVNAGSGTGYGIWIKDNTSDNNLVFGNILLGNDSQFTDTGTETNLDEDGSAMANYNLMDT